MFEQRRARLEQSGNKLTLSGNWTVGEITGIQAQIDSLQWPNGQSVVIDAESLGNMDTSGAWLIYRARGAWQGAGHRVTLDRLAEHHVELLDLVEDRVLAAGEPPPLEKLPGVLEHIGTTSWGHYQSARKFLAFIGETSFGATRSLLNPSRIRWKVLLANVESAGVNAIPIVGLLSFLIGVVIAYQAGEQLKLYGANIFIVEMVCLTMVRELAPLMAAIIVAGRTGSAYTAQIGTMKVTEEVDALATIGIPPMDMLVLPKLFALVISLPLLTIYADVLGIFGGMVMAFFILDVNFSDFLDRIPTAMSLTSFLIGISKAPVFAAIIALVGCYQGFQVSGGADSVGKQTTVSVVQAIFLVIVVDAIFSVMFSWLGI